ncbi:hypothetical protein ACWAUC_19710 [Bradyrhizobium guangdongense]
MSNIIDLAAAREAAASPVTPTPETIGEIANPPVAADIDDLDRASKIMQAAVTYTSLTGAINGAWIAEHTGNSTVAEIVIDGMSERKDATLRRLTRLIDKADKVRTVEIWSLASLAKVVLNQLGDGHSGENLAPFEVAFMQSLFGLIERDCKRRERDQ